MQLKKNVMLPLYLGHDVCQHIFENQTCHFALLFHVFTVHLDITTSFIYPTECTTILF